MFPVNKMSETITINEINTLTLSLYSILIVDIGLYATNIYLVMFTYPKMKVFNKNNPIIDANTYIQLITLTTFK